MQRLTAAQCATFAADGYLAPVDAFSDEEAAEGTRRLEALLAPYAGRPDVRLRNNPHLLLRWVADLVCDPRVVDAVADVLGPDLLILRTTLFVKPPGDLQYVAWHQDVAYWALSDSRIATAWIALTDSTATNGCVRVVPGSHHGPPRAHRLTRDRRNILLRGQAADDVVPPERVTCIELRAGQFSLHDGRVLHGSTGNPSARLRAGLAVRYIRPDVRQGGPRPSAMLVRGVDALGHYRHQLAPRFDFDPAARAWHARSLRHYAALVVWQALQRPSPRQLTMLARAVGRGGTLRALCGRWSA